MTHPVQQTHGDKSRDEPLLPSNPPLPEGGEAYSKAVHHALNMADELEQMAADSHGSVQAARLKDSEAIRIILAQVNLPVRSVEGDRIAELEATLEPRNGEQYKFEEWAKSQRYEMHEHPLHYIFLDEKTNAARMGWKAALAYARAVLPKPPLTGGE